MAFGKADNMGGVRSIRWATQPPSTISNSEWNMNLPSQVEHYGTALFEELRHKIRHGK
jgi:hypothetical protein